MSDRSGSVRRPPGQGWSRKLSAQSGNGNWELETGSVWARERARGNYGAIMRGFANSGSAGREHRRHEIVIRERAETRTAGIVRLRGVISQETKLLARGVHLGRLIRGHEITPAAQAVRPHVQIPCAPGGRLDHHAGDAAQLLTTRGDDGEV